MKDSDVIAQITWTVGDMRNAYLEKYGHNGTDEEIRECVNALDVKTLESSSIETGWNFINSAVI